MRTVPREWCDVSDMGVVKLNKNNSMKGEMAIG